MKINTTLIKNEENLKEDILVLTALAGRAALSISRMKEKKKRLE